MAASFSSKTFMITGGSGTIGSGIIRHVLQKGASLRRGAEVFPLTVLVAPSDRAFVYKARPLQRGAN